MFTLCDTFYVILCPALLMTYVLHGVVQWYSGTICAQSMPVRAYATGTLCTHVVAHWVSMENPLWHFVVRTCVDSKCDASVESKCGTLWAPIATACLSVSSPQGPQGPQGPPQSSRLQVINNLLPPMMRIRGILNLDCNGRKLKQIFCL